MNRIRMLKLPKLFVWCTIYVKMLRNLMLNIKNWHLLCVLQVLQRNLEEIKENSSTIDSNLKETNHYINSQSIKIVDLLSCDQKEVQNMFWLKKSNPEIKIKKTGSLLLIQLYIKNIHKAKMQCVIESENTLLIGDIIHNNEKKYNKGYGSAMMEKLISYAKEKGYSRLYGNLSDVDICHKDRLYHFYGKFGFTITEYPKIRDCYFGYIEKIL